MNVDFSNFNNTIVYINYLHILTSVTKTYGPIHFSLILLNNNQLFTYNYTIYIIIFYVFIYQILCIKKFKTYNLKITYYFY